MSDRQHISGRDMVLFPSGDEWAGLQMDVVYGEGQEQPQTERYLIKQEVSESLW